MEPTKTPDEQQDRTTALLEKADDKKETIRDAAELVSNFFFSFFLTIFIIIAVTMVALRMLGFTLLNVETGSMTPELPVNTLVFVQKVAAEDIVKGDIVTFVLDEKGTLATHRVVRVNEKSRSFVTKGDANNAEDPPVAWENLVGKVQFHLPAVGGLFQKLTSPQARPVVITVIAVLVAVMFLWEHVVRAVRKKRGASGEEQTDVQE